MKMVLEHPKSQYYLFRGFVVALPEMLPPNLFLFSFHMVREPSCNRKEILKLTLPLQDKQTKQLVDQFYLLTLYCQLQQLIYRHKEKTTALKANGDIGRTLSTSKCRPVLFIEINYIVSIDLVMLP